MFLILFSVFLGSILDQKNVIAGEREREKERRTTVEKESLSGSTREGIGRAWIGGSSCLFYLHSVVVVVVVAVVMFAW